MKKPALIFICFCLATGEKTTFSQERILPDSIRADDLLLESVLEASTREVGHNEFADRLEFLTENPLDLNSATEDELQQLPGIDPILSARIVQERLNKPFGSVEDLVRVTGMTSDQVKALKPFIIVRDLDKSDIEKRTQVMFRGRIAEELQVREGYRQNVYPGSRVALYQRLLVGTDVRIPGTGESANVHAGALVEKDPGEPDWYDHASAFVSVRSSSVPIQVLAGDFRMGAAHGLVFGASQGPRKSGDVFAPARVRAEGIRGNTSSEEATYFRGFAINGQASILTASILYSRMSLAATVTDSGEISSIYSSGLFRTVSEKSKRNATYESTLGLRIVARISDELSIGLSGIETRFDRAFVSFNNATTKGPARVAGLDAVLTGERYRCSIEMAVTSQSGTGLIAGLVLKPTSHLDFILVARSYSQHFGGRHSSSFSGSGGDPQNEVGFYSGVRAKPLSWMSVSGFFDQYGHPHGREGSGVRQKGTDMLVLGEFRLSRRVTTVLEWRERGTPGLSEVSDSIGRVAQKTSEFRQNNYRATLDVTLGPGISWRSRGELVNTSGTMTGENEQGMLVYEEVRASLPSGFSAAVRFVLFQTDSYASRIYEFERDVRGSFTQPALFGKGFRWYLLLQHRIMMNMNLSLKYDATIHEGIRSIGSGFDAIRGDLDDAIKLQFDAAF